MDITSLPNELILAVAECIDNQVDRNSFAQSCRSIYASANESVYRYNRIYRKSSAAKWAVSRGFVGTLQHCAAAGVDIDDPSLELLHHAAISKHADVARFLLSLDGMDADYTDDSDWSPMFYACRSNAVGVVEALLEHGVSPSRAGLEGWTPLSIAASFDSCDVARLLLQHGAPVNAQSDNGSTALKAASRGSYSKVAAILLEAGADPNIPAFGGWVPLHSAAKYSNIALLELLIKYGADIECTQERGYTALTLAVEAYNCSMVEALLDHGANANTTTSSGWSPLTLATDMGDMDTTRLLLERGADHSWAVSGEWCALNLAAYNGQEEIVDLLLEFGAHVDGCKEVGRTALVNTLDKDCFDIAENLIQRGARLDIRTSTGETPLLRAVRTKKTKFVLLLLKYGANASAQNAVGWTPVIMAVHTGHVAVIQDLIEASSANLNYSDMDDRTALIHACMRRQDAAAVKLLQNYDVNLSLRDRYGSTALSMAVRNGCDDAAEIILSKLEPSEAHKDKDMFGRSIYYWARRSGSWDVLRLLQRYTEQFNLRPDWDITTMDSQSTPFNVDICWCDVCGQCRIHRTITSRCTVCDEGDFLICTGCREYGAQCRSKDHVWDSFVCESVA